MKLSTLTFIIAGLSTSIALAAAPKPGIKNPGRYHWPVGSFDVTTVSDGWLKHKPLELLTNIKPDKIRQLLAKHFCGEEIENSINTFVINTGSKLVLVDSGAGNIFGANAGQFLENLKTAGYTPDQIDAVMITHIHPDHLGGLTNNGKLTFPNATLFIDKRDVDYISNPETIAKLPEQMKPFFEHSLSNIQAYQKAGKLNAFTGKTEIVPGVNSRECAGHTPGHTCYEVKDSGETLVLIGDSLHIAAVQFEVPSAGMKFDKDAKAANANRERVLKDAAKEKEMIGAAHVAFPGIGHVRKEKTGYTFVPANYLHE